MSWAIEKIRLNLGDITRQAIRDPEERTVVRVVLSQLALATDHGQGGR